MQINKRFSNKYKIKKLENNYNNEYSNEKDSIYNPILINIKKEIIIISN